MTNPLRKAIRELESARPTHLQDLSAEEFAVLHRKLKDLDGIAKAMAAGVLAIGVSSSPGAAISKGRRQMENAKAGRQL